MGNPGDKVAASSRKIRLVLDAVGGKYAPHAIVEGAVLASRRWEEVDFTLTGNTATLSGLVDQYGGQRQRFAFLEAGQRIDETESPVQALREKPEASILRALDLHRQGAADAVISAGSTGAQIVASIQTLGLLEGVRRPAIGSYLPTQSGRTFIIDVGANVSCKPIHLLQFAVMGAIFRQLHDALPHPRIALLSNGEESTKGDHVTREAYELLAIVPQLNFIGNVEGNDLIGGKADVVVCDGFTGNVLLKFAETIPNILRQYAQNQPEESAALRSALDPLFKSFDYQEFGGVPLLGVNGISLICHGHSTPKAIASAIAEAIKMVHLQVNQRISEQLSAMGQWAAAVKTRAFIGRIRRRSWREKD